MTFRWAWVTMLLVGCDEVPKPPPDPPPVDECQGLTAVIASATPATVRVNGAATLSASGGLGRYTFTVVTNATGGSISGDRYVAGPTPGTDVLQAADTCGNAGTVRMVVGSAFQVSPVLATVKPGTTFTLEVQGLVGTAQFSSQGALASGGSISAAGVYVAGSRVGTDLVVVRDSTSGDQVLVRYSVDPAAKFRAAPSKLALPSSSYVPLGALDGSGRVDWRIVSGGGMLDKVAGDDVFRTGPVASGTTQLEGVDHFTKDKTTVSVRVLTELTRPNTPQGRRTDLATLVTGDFDGDGLQDVALGVPESDLGRPTGGAVFIFKGTASGLPTTPTWTILGATDTAQLGTVMAAGDLNGDGRDDLAISAPGDDLTVADSGAVYLYAITATGPVLIRPALTGLGRGNFGASLAIADVDGDGDNDLIVGSPGAELAPGAGYTARGVIDLFVLQKDQPISDLGTIRLSGYDLAADGTWRRFSNLRAGRGLVAADLNADGRVDLAFLTTVNNTLLGGTARAAATTAIAVHFGRAGTQRFAETPDLFVLPSNPADGDEGTWRLGLVPATGSTPTLLLAVGDRLDSPNLSAADAGTAGGQNAGGALLFDLTANHPTTAPMSPGQVGRTEAFARLYGDSAAIGAGRSFGLIDVDGDGARELVLGAPYAAGPQPNSGKLLIYRLRSLTKGAQENRPDLVRTGAARTDTLGTALTVWNQHVVAFNSRATTSLGDFTGRLDVFSTGSDPAQWTASAMPVPAVTGGQGFGTTVEVGAVQGALRAIVGVPNISGPAIDDSGNELQAGQAVVFATTASTPSTVLMEGASTPYVRDGGWKAFGGRPIATDVAMTDFDGDGQLDAVIGAPSFGPPTVTADGGSSSPDYALVRPACLAPSGQTTGGVMIHMGRADGTFKEGVRAWALRDIPGCTIPDGGGGAFCQRSGEGRAIAGGFDFNHDGKQDLAMTRANGLEIVGGQALDDAQLNKPTMACTSLYSLPSLPWGTSAPAALGDLDGDGCDDVGVRYSDGGNRQGVLIIFGFNPDAAKCSGHTGESYLRISGDPETGVATMRLGVSLTRAGKVTADGRDWLAITADLYPYLGQTQPVVLLLDVAEVVSKRPASGGRLISIQGDLTPVPLVPPALAPGFGRVLRGNVDVTGDGKVDLLVSSTGANVNGDGTGAIYVFAGGAVKPGLNVPAMLVVGDESERAAFGQDLSVSLSKSGVPAALGIGAPLSYRTGTANGTAFVLPLDF